MTIGSSPSDKQLKRKRDLFGIKFLRAFYRLVQTVKTHPDNNKLLIECTKDFATSVAQWCKDEAHLTIQVSRGRFFLEEEKLHYPRETVYLVHEMMNFFQLRGLRGLRFDSDIKDASLDQILAFAHVLNDAEKQEDPLAWLLEQRDAGEFPWAEIISGPAAGEQERILERKKIARRTYSHALSSLKEVSQKITTEGRAGVSKVKRIVQNMVDLLMEDESVILGMSTIRDYHDYTYTHSVNVAILALCLGKRMGLSRLSLRRLGICGLVHDLGKVEVPYEILNKSGKLTKEEIKEIEKHPLSSVRQIIRLRASSSLKAKIVLPPFEHHLKYDLSGYPRAYRKKPVSLFGRILAIADVYDAMTSARVYRPRLVSPDRTLGIMLKGAGKDFDPILLKVFVNMLGIYPMGTVLRLDTGEVGLVNGTPGESDRGRPQVLLLASDGKGGFKKGKTVNLAERHPKTGAFRRNVKATFHPSTLGIQPAEFLV
ncbi:MAG: HD-GYP domain-containing protein [Thermodesulfobacteriota bacterium]|nr:HD-GYP domain-containing protein [Thermodesulfobacteriota bacterium]